MLGKSQKVVFSKAQLFLGRGCLSGSRIKKVLIRFTKLKTPRLVLLGHGAYMKTFHESKNRKVID